MRFDRTLLSPCLMMLAAAACGGTTSSKEATSGSATSAAGAATPTSGSAAPTGAGAGVSSGPTSGTAIGPASGVGTTSGGGLSGGTASGTGVASTGSGSGATSGSSSAGGETSGGSSTGVSATSGSPGADASVPFDGAFPPTVDSGAVVPLGDQTLPRKLYIENHCTYSIWSWALPPSTFPGSVPLKTDAGQAYVVGWPDQWQGRIWGRTKCDTTGKNCAQGNGPDTLAEFALTAGMASDWYDISLVDGFSIPTAILQVSQSFTLSGSFVPGAFNAGGTFVVGSKLGPDGLCGSPVCAVDLLQNCPAAQVKKGPDGTIAACHNGDNGAGQLAGYFKAGCPTSYSWPFDDPWSLFRCADYRQNNGVGSKDYKIVYCPEQGPTPGFPTYPITQ
jgi:hypothetical protein